MKFILLHTMQALALLLGMGDKTCRWGWRCYVYCLLTLLQTIAAVEEGAKEKQIAEDSFMNAVKMFTKQSSCEAVLMPNEKNDSVSSIVTAFYMWSKDYKNGKEYQKILPSNDMKKLNFTPRKTFIIIHGFLSNGLEEWIPKLKDKLLSREDCNVISVDWPAGNPNWLFSYYTAVGYVSSVGNDTATLLKNIYLNKGLDISSVHLIGHGLGGHAAGFCGKFTRSFIAKLIGRISGLDPAGLCFHKTGKNYRLDKTDASYVDVIHTNGCNPSWKWWTDCFGINENIGHTDFWPNGGEHQPFCNKILNNGSVQLMSQHNHNLETIDSHHPGEIKYEAAWGCNQEMAHTYFSESTDYNTEETYFLARPCLSWETYDRGLCPCGEYAQYMGYNSVKGINGAFYLTTNSNSPFAKRDPSCPSAGSQINYFIIVVSTSTSVVVMALMIIILGVYCGVRRVRRRNKSQSGLVVEAEEESNW